MAVESRLTQAVLKEAKKFLHEETSNQGKDMPVGMPFRVPPTRWYEEKIKEFTAPSRETLIRQGDMRSKNQGPFFGDEKPNLAIAELKGAMKIFKANKNISWYRDCRLAIRQIKDFARFPPKFADLWLRKNLKRIQDTFENSVLDFESILKAN